MQHIDYFTAGDIAVFILTFIVGLALSVVFRARGVTGCFTYIISLAIIILVILALMKGYSLMFNDITFHLQEYIYYNSVGVVGVVLGLVIGFFIRRRK